MVRFGTMPSHRHAPTHTQLPLSPVAENYGHAVFTSIRSHVPGRRPRDGACTGSVAVLEKKRPALTGFVHTTTLQDGVRSVMPRGPKKTTFSWRMIVHGAERDTAT